MLRAKLEAAINKVMDDAAEKEEESWEGYIHTNCVRQMAIAAEAVFDSCMEAQEFAKEQK